MARRDDLVISNHDLASGWFFNHASWFLDHSRSLQRTQTVAQRDQFVVNAEEYDPQFTNDTPNDVADD
jgi:hypothetical protein